MTSATDHDAHPDVIEIADFAEDLLPAERAAQVRTHIGSCPQCAEVLASLQEIGTLLGDLPAAEPMPADVAARIDAALAAEADHPAETGRPAGTAAGIEARADIPRARVPRETSPHASDRPPTDVPRGTSAPAGRPATPTGPGRGSRRRRGLLIAALSSAGILLLGGGVYELAAHSGSSASKSDSAAVRSGAKDAGPVADVGADVARLLASGEGTKGGASVGKSPMLGGDGSTTVTAPDGSATSVPLCVLKATQRTERPLAAEREDFLGVDSYLVVLPDPAGGDQVDAFVLTAACTADSPAQVLFQNSYPQG
ncbi:anti-sigma factor family protein [Actinacidiphila epipremni]|uniref:Zinc-finger domain-containing protein n=1 Tax=Actinacidiphila epipremni TaxID=2053013 RepID=A0ABX0ZI74_9ACTN|nr:hypothetical protein [Actinacidiphila epipremni]NJP42996.1 hypothetical protein [Actinacidiphila epipremni]